MSAINPKELENARSELVTVAQDHFKADPNVLAIFIGGSLAAGTADEFSDIDLRVVVNSEHHKRFVESREEIPKQWPGFLFNEWVPRAQHCVSHFRPFLKIDIFYYSASAFLPSPWYRLPIKILHDPRGVVADVIRRSDGLQFIVPETDIDFSISKSLAAAHETYRRVRRGEFFYAQTLLDELRLHVMHADDWLFDRTPQSTVHSKFHQRASENIRAVLIASYCPYDADAILAALRSLVSVYREQVIRLHEKFPLSRPLENDIAALKVIC
ncbi:nucleotidyltransferase domain-containing protein [Rhizobium leguminosarum]|nr:nucleotidyltransferase domain-containing protein [Rhizobium leguminosarum]